MNRNDDRIIEGMKRQAEARQDQAAKSSRLGWKSGFGTEGAMSLIEVSQPLVGFLTDATLLESGASVDVSGWTMPLIEPEVAVRIGTAIGAGASPEEGTAAIDAAAAAIELVDLGAVDDVSNILAGNIFHRHVILGEFTHLDDGGLDAIRIAVTANGTKGEFADPREVIGNIGKVIAALADQADLYGETFQPGDVVITGAAVPPAPLQPGDAYEVELSNQSSVSVAIA